MADPDRPTAAETLAGLDAQIAAGTIDLVEYWRRRAEIESGSLADQPSPPGQLPVPPVPGGGTVEFLPPAPSLPSPAGQDGATAAPVRPAPATRREAARGGEADPGLAGIPTEDVPFAPPSGAVNLRYRAEPPPPRRWWRRNRGRSR